MRLHGADKTLDVAKEHRIVEGEMLGAPVPGGWPDKGPFEALMRRIRRRRSQDETPHTDEKPADS